MTVKSTVSMTDQAFEFAKSLVEKGKFASVSAVVQHGLGLVEREAEEHQARLDAIRADLERRAEKSPISTDEMDERLANWREMRDRSPSGDLA